MNSTIPIEAVFHVVPIGQEAQHDLVNLCACGGKRQQVADASGHGYLLPLLIHVPFPQDPITWFGWVLIGR
jgi:hypothetical protein